MTVALQSSDGATVYAQTVLGPVAANWTEYAVRMNSSATDTAAQLSISVPINCGLDLDMVSLFPAANGRLGEVSPFRQDLLHLLQDLNPK